MKGALSIKLAAACAIVSSSVQALHIQNKFRNTNRQRPFIGSVSVAAVDSTISSEPDLDISEIFEGNEKYVQSKLEEDPKYFEKLGDKHSPKYLYIGPVDARTSPDLILGAEEGTMLTIQNIANVVSNNDLGMMSAIHFAINELAIQHVIVCGQYECGGVRASVANINHAPPLSLWLRHLRDVYRLHARELDGIRDPEVRQRRLVDLNVIEQCVNLHKTGVIQAKRIDSIKNHGAPAAIPRIHAVVFDPKTGVVKKLQVDFDKYMNELNNIYDLHGMENSNIPA